MRIGYAPPVRALILKTGSTLPSLIARRGDFEDWFAARLGRPREEVTVVDAQRAAKLPAPSSPDCVIVTGSPATVHEHEPWSDRAGAWLAEVVGAGVPVLGVCYGHQLLADALGGRTARNPHGREIGPSRVELVEDDPLFEGLPRAFSVLESHVDAVIDPPPGARLLARNARCAVQALRFAPKAWGVQWHPEFDDEVMREYLEARRERIDAELGAGEAARLLAALTETPASGATILRNFWRLAGR